jgi:hypothetical protein
MTQALYARLNNKKINKERKSNQVLGFPMISTWVFLKKYPISF